MVIASKFYKSIKIYQLWLFILYSAHGNKDEQVILFTYNWHKTTLTIILTHIWSKVISTDIPSHKCNAKIRCEHLRVYMLFYFSNVPSHISTSLYPLHQYICLVSGFKFLQRNTFLKILILMFFYHHKTWSIDIKPCYHGNRMLLQVLIISMATFTVEHLW